MKYCTVLFDYHTYQKWRETDDASRYYKQFYICCCSGPTDWIQALIYALHFAILLLYKITICFLFTYSYFSIYPYLTMCCARSECDINKMLS